MVRHRADSTTTARGLYVTLFVTRETYMHGCTTADLIEQNKLVTNTGRMLEHDVTNWDPPIPTDRETDSRHGHWKGKRALVAASLQRTNLSYARLNRFNCCGSCAVLEWSESLQRHRVTCWHCRDRMCEPCQQKRKLEITKIVKKNVGPRQARFVTLTLKHQDAPLKEQIRRLRQAFNRLKRTKVWSTAIRGGLAILELKRETPGEKENEFGIRYQTDGLWHPHLHCIVTGTWIDRDELCAQWLSITKDSHQVDVRLVRDSEKAGHYIAKYVTKATNNAVYENPEWLDEFITATKGARVYNTFGNWESVRQDEDTTPTAKDWKHVATIHDLHAAAERGERWAIDVYLSIHKQPTDLHRRQKPRQGRQAGP